MLISVAFGGEQFDVEQYLQEIHSDNIDGVLAKTGPTKLQRISAGEDTVTLSIKAANDLLSRANVTDDIGLLISVTATPRLEFPGNSFEIAAALRLSDDIQLIDLNAGCTGFVDALSIALRLQKKTLIICAETYSQHMNYDQRSVQCLFADGASAVYIDPSDYRIEYENSKYVKGSYNDISRAQSQFLTMNGASVYTFGLSVVGAELSKALSIHPECAYAFIHQGSKLIVETLSHKLSSYNGSMPSNITQRGNLVSATLPCLIRDSIGEKFPIGDKILLCGFGVGLYCHTLIIRKVS